MRSMIGLGCSGLGHVPPWPRPNWRPSQLWRQYSACVGAEHHPQLAQKSAADHWLVIGDVHPVSSTHCMTFFKVPKIVAMTSVRFAWSRLRELGSPPTASLRCSKNPFA
jgi:hypothetical protein